MENKVLGFQLEPVLAKLTKRWGDLTGPQLLEGGCWERGGDFFQEGCNFHIKNKLKSEIFNDKKSFLAKIFLSVITKNSTWGIYLRIWLLLKDKIVLRMKNFKILGVH